ncbi:hypothetical protein AWZ03_015167 [Drosophila navojoa]|uniref:Uncharacterized protein n=1 Tax=Drosophila navojoa TaxID=7232 RepID=A0A484AQJ0_DRONA|nr:hypothetical protein AWZ03_015167 [Drosophila navojoa]
MKMKEEPIEEVSLRSVPSISIESDRSGGPKWPKVRGQERKRGPEAACWSPTLEANVVLAGGGLPVDGRDASKDGESPARSIERCRSSPKVELKELS